MSQEEFNQLVKRFDKLEDMMAQLIHTVGNVMEEQTSMKNEITSIKDGQASMKVENETRHQEVMEQLSILKADQDLIWDKSTKNEREIGIVKKLYDF